MDLRLEIACVAPADPVLHRGEAGYPAFPPCSTPRYQSFSRLFGRNARQRIISGFGLYGSGVEPSGPFTAGNAINFCWQGCRFRAIVLELAILGALSPVFCRVLLNVASLGSSSLNGRHLYVPSSGADISIPNTPKLFFITQYRAAILHPALVIVKRASPTHSPTAVQRSTSPFLDLSRALRCFGTEFGKQPTSSLQITSNRRRHHPKPQCSIQCICQVSDYCPGSPTQSRPNCIKSTCPSSPHAN